MAVPSRHIGRVKAVQGAAPNHHVLEHLVYGMTNVDIAVGVGRAIHEHKPGSPLAMFPESFIATRFLPMLEHNRLAIGQVRLHGELRHGKVQRILVIHTRSHFSCQSFATTGEYLTGSLQVTVHLVNHQMHIVEAMLVAQLGHEAHFQVATVNVAVKIE